MPGFVTTVEKVKEREMWTLSDCNSGRLPVSSSSFKGQLWSGQDVGSASSPTQWRTKGLEGWHDRSDQSKLEQSKFKSKLFCQRGSLAKC